MGPSRGHGVPAPSTEPGTEQLLGNHHTELEISLTPATLGVTVFKSQWLPSLLIHCSFPEALRKQIPGPHPGDSDSGMKGWGERPGICICIKHLEYTAGFGDRWPSDIILAAPV